MPDARVLCNSIRSFPTVDLMCNMDAIKLTNVFPRHLSSRPLPRPSEQGRLRDARVAPAPGGGKGPPLPVARPSRLHRIGFPAAAGYAEAGRVHKRCMEAPGTAGSLTRAPQIILVNDEE